MVLTSFLYHTAHDYMLAQFPKGNGEFFMFKGGEGSGKVDMKKSVKLNLMEDLFNKESKRPNRMLNLHPVKYRDTPYFLSTSFP